MKNLTKISLSLVVSTALFLSNLSSQEIHKDTLQQEEQLQVAAQLLSRK